MSEAKDIEILRAKKAKLEAESRSLKETEECMENQVKILEEKIAIRELTRSNKALQEVVSRLESRKMQLEKSIKELQGTQRSTASQEDKNPEDAKNSEASNTPRPDSTVFEENQDGGLVLEEIDPDSLFENPKVAEIPEKQQEKKKHRFF
jgi:hypothetical protein